MKADLEVAKRQIQEKDDEIARLCKHRANSPVVTGEFHSAHSTPFTSLSTERDSPMGDEMGPMSMPTEVSELQKKVTEKHKRIVDLERRLDRAAKMNSEVERLTIELSKYEQGGEGSEVSPSKESSQGAAQEPAYISQLKNKFEEAERRGKYYEKVYREEIKKHAELEIEVKSLKSRIADVKDASGTTTNIDDFQVVEDKKKSDLQEKEKEIRALQVKVKELEKAAVALERIQQHSKAQSHHLMSLQDEVKVKIQ